MALGDSPVRRVLSLRGGRYFRGVGLVLRVCLLFIHCYPGRHSHTRLGSRGRAEFEQARLQVAAVPDSVAGCGWRAAPVRVRS